MFESQVSEFRISKSLNNSLIAVSNLFLANDFAAPSWGTTFEFLINHKILQSRYLKITLQQGTRFFDGESYPGIIVSISEEYIRNSSNEGKQKRSLEGFASFKQYVNHTTDFIEYVEKMLREFLRNLD